SAPVSAEIAGSFCSISKNHLGLRAVIRAGSFTRPYVSLSLRALLYGLPGSVQAFLESLRRVIQGIFRQLNTIDDHCRPDTAPEQVAEPRVVVRRPGPGAGRLAARRFNEHLGMCGILVPLQEHIAVC